MPLSSGGPAGAPARTAPPRAGPAAWSSAAEPRLCC